MKKDVENYKAFVENFKSNILLTNKSKVIAKASEQQQIA